MKLEINNQTTTLQVKRFFNHKFPYLKIEFFTVKHKSGEPSQSKDMIHENLLLNTINPALKESSLLIDPAMSVAAFETKFQESVGIPVQVFRKHHEVWIETTHTDHFSLDDQNETGKESCTELKKERSEDRYLEDGQY